MSFFIEPNKLLTCFYYFKYFIGWELPLGQTKKGGTIPWKKKIAVVLLQLALKKGAESEVWMKSTRKEKPKIINWYPNSPTTRPCLPLTFFFWMPLPTPGMWRRQGVRHEGPKEKRRRVLVVVSPDGQETPLWPITYEALKFSSPY